MIRFLFAALLLVLNSPVHAASLIADPQNLAATFKSARPGDKITLSGAFPATKLAARSFAPALSIDATAATFTSLTLQNVTGVHWTGGSFGPAPEGATGLMVDGSTDVTVDKLKVSHVEFGVVFQRSTRFQLTNAWIDTFYVDGFRVFCAQQGYLAHLTVLNGQPRNRASQHPDGGQLASACGATKTPAQKMTADILIEDVYIATDGQGLNGLSHAPDPGFERVTFRNVRVATTCTHGIGLNNCRDCEISGSQVQSLPGFFVGGAVVEFAQGSTGEVEANTVLKPTRAAK